ncbi:MAG: FAD-dependent oxidoreductase [Deltaproteobacteria bacterium]|nr:FAD-dependent oxidoreductase [Deltaproteobacteria bacterium]
MFVPLLYSPFANYLSLSYLKSNIDEILLYFDQHFLETITLYFTLYVLITATAIPGAGIMTLAGGVLFGLLWGTVVVSFASSIGAFLSFLFARFLFRDWIQNRFRRRLKGINDGIRKDGAFYLFTLRLIPIFPFFIINLILGVTPIRSWTFYWISQLGMLPGTIVYVNAGLQLSKIESVRDIFSPELILSFTLLGIFPLIAKKGIQMLNAVKVFRPYKKPRKFDYNMVVIGAGAGGLVTSYICAAAKAKVALIEKDKMGGECLNTGCVPSKALLKVAKLVYDAKRAEEFGLKGSALTFDFADVMEHVQQTIRKIAPHDSVERYTKLGVDCIHGQARIVSPWEIDIDGKRISTRNITIAAGASPLVPPFPGLEEIDYLSSDTLWNLQELPQRLLVLGAGPIGCEMAQAFTRLGSEVTMVEMLPRVLTIEDEDVSAFVKEKLSSEGVKILTKHRAVKFHKRNGTQTLLCEYREKTIALEFDKVLIAIGRKPNVSGYGLEELGIALRHDHTIETNAFMQTKFPNIFACGDVTGPYQLTHASGYQGELCALNGLFGKVWKFKANYDALPWTTFTDPEVATVGLNETLAQHGHIPYELTKYSINDLDRALADNEAHGFVKILTAPGSDKILGATIVSNHASEMLLEFVTAIKNKIGLRNILRTTHAYPTMGEANKYAAGEWRKAHMPSWLRLLL